MKKCRRKKKCIVCKNISPVQHQAQVASLHFAFFFKISVDANRGNNMESQQYADCKHSIYKHIYLCIMTTPWQLNDKSPVICIAHYMKTLHAHYTKLSSGVTKLSPHYTQCTNWLQQGIDQCIKCIKLTLQENPYTFHSFSFKMFLMF